MEKKTVTTVAIILLLSMLVCSTMFNISDEEVIDNIYNQHRNVTALNQTTKMDTVISKVEAIDNNGAGNGAGVNNPNSPNIPGVSGGSSYSNTGWLATCDAVHKAWGVGGLTYVYGGYKDVNVDGTSYKVRTDCSGYVGFCMYKMGWAKSVTPISSQDDLTPFGFTLIDASSRQPGDVLVYPGHIEVLYEIGTNGVDTVYNWGGTSSTGAKYKGIDATTVATVKSYSTSGHKQSAITKVWRPPATVATTGTGGVGKTVFLDAGHNCNYKDSSNPGPHGYAEGRCPAENEFTVNMREDLKKELLANGYTVITVEDCGGTLAEWGNSGRAELFNNSSASVMIQLHSNAAKNPNTGAHGGDAHCYSGSKELAQCIMKYYGETAVGIHGNGDGVVEHSKDWVQVFKYSNKPCVILEAGFGNTHGDYNNPSAYEADYDKLRDPAVRQQIAVAVRKGLDDYFTTH